jgi:hypothetical protein
MNQCFASCSCGGRWVSRKEFLSDPNVVLYAYVPSLHPLQLGRFQFTHHTEYCGDTVSLNAGLFADMYSGPDSIVSGLDTTLLPGYCLFHSSPGPTRMVNEDRFVRELIETIDSWPKELRLPDSVISVRR